MTAVRDTIFEVRCITCLIALNASYFDTRGGSGICRKRMPTPRGRDQSDIFAKISWKAHYKLKNNCPVDPPMDYFVKFCKLTDVQTLCRISMMTNFFEVWTSVILKRNLSCPRCLQIQQRMPNDSEYLAVHQAQIKSSLWMLTGQRIWVSSKVLCNLCNFLPVFVKTVKNKYLIFTCGHWQNGCSASESVIFWEAWSYFGIINFPDKKAMHINFKTIS